jgi:hypothetical protein
LSQSDVGRKGGGVTGGLNISSKIDAFFIKAFKTLLLTFAVLLLLQTAAAVHSDILFVLLLTITIMVGRQLRSWTGRLTVAVVIFFVVPWFGQYIASTINPIIVLSMLAILSATAYRLREYRRGRRSEPFRNQGGERTPILPPERNE